MPPQMNDEMDFARPRRQSPSSPRAADGEGAASPAAVGGNPQNPQEMTPPKEREEKATLAAEYGELTLNDEEDDENDLVDEELGGGGGGGAQNTKKLKNGDEDDDNSLVDGTPPSKKGMCSGEDRTSSLTVAFWLLFWLANNVALTLLNKATFASYDFKYPFFLSFFHMTCNWVGGTLTMWIAERRGRSQEKGEYAPLSSGGAGNKNKQLKRSKSLVLDGLTSAELDRSGSLKMWAFSVVFSLNIAIGNVSLRYVSVNFNQVMRSLVPAMAILFGMCLGKKTSGRRKAAVVPVIGGVAMACYGEMELTAVGFVFTSLCVVLAALKAVAAGEILTGELKLHPVDLLHKMAPKAAIQCLLLSIFTSELTSIVSRFQTDLNPMINPYPTIGVVSTGIMSFSLNISSLMSNKLTSPLTLCIAANVKQVLMIAMATAIFHTPITPLNGGGIGVVLVGSGIYSVVSLMEKQQAATAAAAAAATEKKVVVAKEEKMEAGGIGEDGGDNDNDDEDEEHDEGRALIGSAVKTRQ